MVPTASKVELRVAKNGYAEQVVVQVCNGDDVVIPMAASGEITGSIVASDAVKTVGAVTVVLVRIDVPKSIEVERRALKDDNRTFRFDVAPGEYALRAESTVMPAAHATAIEVHAGETSRVELVFEAAVAVSGQIVDEQGNPVGGVRVGTRMETERYARTDAHGDFSVLIRRRASGDPVILRASKGGYGPVEVPVDLAATGDGEIHAVRIVLAPGASVCGWWYPTGGGGLPGAPVYYLGSRGRPRFVSEATVACRTGTDGRFELRDLPAGMRGGLLLCGRDGERCFVHLARLRAGEQRDVGVLRGSKPARIRGIVCDAEGAPLEGVNVAGWVEPEGGTRLCPDIDAGQLDQTGRGRWPDTFTRRDGTFVLEGIEPGSCQLLLTHGELEYDAPTLTLVAGETRDVGTLLPKQRPVPVAGRVYFAGDVPPGKVGIHLAWDRGRADCPLGDGMSFEVARTWGAAIPRASLTVQWRGSYQRLACETVLAPRALEVHVPAVRVLQFAVHGAAMAVPRGLPLRAIVETPAADGTWTWYATSLIADDRLQLLLLPGVEELRFRLVGGATARADVRGPAGGDAPIPLTFDKHQ